MSSSIHNISLEQYKFYLNPSLEQKKSGTRWIPSFLLLGFSTLAIIVNRLAYFVLHQFSAYPNHAYLVEKFKFHNFSKIDTQEQYEIANDIFALFQHCTDINQAKLKGLKDCLNKVEERLHPKPKEDKTSDTQVDEDVYIDSSDSSVNSDEDESEESYCEVEGSDATSSSDSLLSSEGERLDDEEDLGELGLEYFKNKEVVEQRRFLSPIPEGDLEEEREDEESVFDSEGEKESLSSGGNSQEGDDMGASTGGASFSSGENEFGQGELNKEENSGVSRSATPTSVDGKLFKVIDEEVPPLLLDYPADVSKVLDNGFLLTSIKSIHDLFRMNMLMIGEKIVYIEGLRTLLRFENQLHSGKFIAIDDRLSQYLFKHDKAFQKAWQAACDQIDRLHEEFIDHFRDAPIELGKNGDIICSVEQWEWVSHILNTQFPELIHLAFDAPSLSIFQKGLVTQFARSIFTGSQVSEEFVADLKECFIVIKETHEEDTPLIIVNSSFRSASFLHDYFVGPSGTLATDTATLKKQLQGLAKSYVKDWIEEEGAILEFGGVSLNGGGVDTQDWVSHLRDVYTEVLNNMDSATLKGEIQKIYDCFLIRLVAQTYADEIDQKDWSESAFPTRVMEKILYLELEKKHDSRVQTTILNTLNQAHFKNNQEIEALAIKAEVSPTLIEPLIRMRVFYLMCCLGQNVIEPVVRNLNRRVQSMCDPTGPNSDFALSSHANEQRILTFDSTLNGLKITVKTQFKDVKRNEVVAEGQSAMHIHSIHTNYEEGAHAGVIELQDLRFNLHPSIEQVRYLVAQIAPKTFIQNVKNLEEEIIGLQIYRKAIRYCANKDVDENQPKWYSKKTRFEDSYKNSSIDLKDSGILLQKGKILVTYLNTQSILSYMNQLKNHEEKDLHSCFERIQGSFEMVCKMIEELYSAETTDKIERGLIERKNALQDLMNAEAIEIFSSESERNSPSKSTDSLSSNESEDERLIGRKSHIPRKTFFNHFYDHTIGRLLNETTEVKYLQWKIERYEDLILGSQKAITTYFYIQENPIDLNRLCEQAGQEGTAEWINRLFPVFQFCQEQLQKKGDRFTPDYLDAVRKSYTNMLQGLRLASSWAKEHPHMPGVQHVNALCHELYTEVDLNKRCQEIVNTFIRLGDRGVKKKSIQTDSRYALIAGLSEIHRKIELAPTEAKNRLLYQLGNSFRGHVNGVFGITSFDPNMQSNPVHVFYEKIVQKEGDKHRVKNIAMGSPTIEKGDGIVHLAPEFEGMLRHYQAHGLVHLYVNNQNYTSTSLLDGNEFNRCQALHTLAEKKFQETLYVLTLNQNSSFYKQRVEIDKKEVSLSKGVTTEPEMNVQKVKEALVHDLLKGKSKGYLPAHLLKIKDLQLDEWMFAKTDQILHAEFREKKEFNNEEERERFISSFHKSLRSYVETNVLQEYPAPNGEEFGYTPYYPIAAGFKKEFIAQLFDGDPIKTGNKIPADLVKKFNLRVWSDCLINRIHEIFFANREELTTEERRIFIRLVYQNLTRKVLLETKANSCNTSCKDRIDRGAASDAEDFAYLSILSGTIDKKEVIDFFKMMIFSRAIIVRKRPIIEERLQRLTETVKFMLDHQTELRQLHGEFFEGVNISVDLFDDEITVNIEEID